MPHLRTKRQQPQYNHANERFKRWQHKALYEKSQGCVWVMTNQLISDCILHLVQLMHFPQLYSCSTNTIYTSTGHTSKENMQIAAAGQATKPNEKTVILKMHIIYWFLPLAKEAKHMG